MPAEPTINTELRGNMIPARTRIRYFSKKRKMSHTHVKEPTLLSAGSCASLPGVLVASGDLTVEPVTGDGVRGIEHVSVRCDEAMAFVKEMCKSGADRAALCCDIDEFCTQSLYRMVHPNVRNRDTDAKLVHAACVENAYADAAAVSFSSYLLRHGYKMSLVRCETLTAAADAASDGDADFCIIPITNSGDGRLNNFSHA